MKISNHSLLNSIAAFLFAAALFLPPLHADELIPQPITENHKCPTCGMRTAPFTNWHTQIVYADKSNDLFCGVKCLMAFIIEPEKYSGSRRPDEKSRFFARDYYTQKWHDMKTMTFVLGSDVLGPMGKDLVPFSDEKSAQTFLEDHRGEAMLEFEQITPELIRRLRQKKGKDL